MEESMKGFCWTFWQNTYYSKQRRKTLEKFLVLFLTQQRVARKSARTTTSLPLCQHETRRQAAFFTMMMMMMMMNSCHENDTTSAVANHARQMEHPKKNVEECMLLFIASSRFCNWLTWEWQVCIKISWRMKMTPQSGKFILAPEWNPRLWRSPKIRVCRESIDSTQFWEKNWQSFDLCRLLQQKRTDPRCK